MAVMVLNIGFSFGTRNCWRTRSTVRRNNRKFTLPAVGRPAGLTALVAALAVVAAKANVVVGASESDVIADLGAPTGTIAVGAKKRLSYPHGTITLIDGKVAAIDAAFASWLEKRAAENEPAPVESVAEKKPASATPAPTGTIDPFGLTTRYFAQPAAYFGGAARTAWLKALAADREENTDPLAAVSYPVEAQSAFVYVPASYDGSRAFGVYVDIRSDQTGGLPLGYDAVCDEHQLIWISPHGAGNDVATARRCALGLDALASLERRYRIDRHRIYAGGFSGGGTIAARLGMLYPEIFHGVVMHARAVYLADVPAGGNNVWPGHFSFLTPNDFKSIAAHGLRAVFVTGPGDMNHSHVAASVTQWTRAGFRVKGFDVKGLGHADAPAATLSDALTWLDRP